MAVLERHEFVAVLELHGWVVSAVAIALGVSRQAVYDRMKRLKIRNKLSAARRRELQLAGNRRGGKRRAEVLSPEELSAQGQNAAMARFAKAS